MGCDIHMFIEYRCGNGMPWQADDHHVPKWEERCRDDKPDEPESWCKPCGRNEKYICSNGYLDFHQVDARGRNYDLFAALASIRGKGPRDPLGLPENVSELVYEASEAYGVDGHSHSYMSIEEFAKVLYEECGYKPTKRSDAFYSHDMPYDKHPPDFTTIVRYAEKLKEEKSIDKHILGKDTTSEVQVRVVFWFDN